MNNTLETLNSIDIANEQEVFFQSTIGKIIDFSINTGIRALLPDSIEDEVINIKDTLISEGFPQGIKNFVNNVINFGKNALGIITGQFENISQVGKSIEKGNLMNNLSLAIDEALNKINSKKTLSEDIINSISKGKSEILNNVLSNIKDELNTQDKNIENLNSYVNSWKLEYENRNIDGMEKYIKKIDKMLSKTLPIENLFQEARTIENLHELIKNNGNNFELSEEELKLAEVI